MQDTIEACSRIERNISKPQAVTLGRLPKVIADAIAGNQSAWRELYQRYDSLIFSTVRPFRLSAINIEDLRQTVWLRLVVHLKNLREPNALPGWIVTTTRNEALKILKFNRRWEPMDPLVDSRLHQIDHVDLGESLHQAERRHALRAVINELRPEHQELLRLLLADPKLSYSDISLRLGIPVGSIGPTRARCLAKLRGYLALHAVSEVA